MNAIILSIGQELISGQTVDTNSAFLALRLAEHGIEAIEHWTLGDSQAPIVQAIRRAAGQADVVIITGGIGPTPDDLTRQALAEAMGSPLVLDEKNLRDLEDFFRRRNRTMVPANRIQAMIPAGARALANRIGTAPGIAAPVGRSRVYVLPGVPSEMKVMFDEVVAPLLPSAGSVIVHRILHTFGQGESNVAAMIEDLMDRRRNPLVGTTVAAGMVSIRITSAAATREDACRNADATAAEISTRLGDLLIGREDESMASAVGELLRRRRLTLATAESCTGGLMGELITSIPGASDYYLGGVIAYANRAKQEMLSVDADLLRRHGAVSDKTARAMAEGCRLRFAGDWAVSVTGIAGPGGGTDEKPVGLVFIGLAGPKTAEVHRDIFPGTRDVIRLRSSLAALNYLRLALKERS